DGRLPAHPRPDHQGDDGHHGRLADHRWRRGPRQLKGSKPFETDLPMSIAADPSGARTVPTARSGRSLRLLPWLGLVPFFVFAGAFLLVPTIKLILGAVQDGAGNFTLKNFSDFGSKIVVGAFTTSIEISLVTAVAGAVFGFLLAYAVISGGLPKPIRTAVLTFSGVASNFAGIPLALAFIFTIGRQGFATLILKGF